MTDVFFIQAVLYLISSFVVSDVRFSALFRICALKGHVLRKGGLKTRRQGAGTLKSSICDLPPVLMSCIHDLLRTLAFSLLAFDERYDLLNCHSQEAEQDF